MTWHLHALTPAPIEQDCAIALFYAQIGYLGIDCLSLRHNPPSLATLVFMARVESYATFSITTASATPLFSILRGCNNFASVLLQFQLAMLILSLITEPA